MSSDLSEDTKKRIWKRDRYRCQECGIRVILERGLRPHTHHIIPKSLGGSDEEKRLITLCQSCHSAKLGHTFMLVDTKVQDFPQYIKWLLWEISINLLAYSDRFDPRNPPDPGELIDSICKVQRALDEPKALTEVCQQQGVGAGTMTFEENFKLETRQVEDIIEGLRIAWKSHYTQRMLDHMIKESRERKGPKSPGA